MSEKEYSKKDVDHAEMIGGVSATLRVFTDEFRSFKVDIKTGMDNFKGDIKTGMDEIHKAVDELKATSLTREEAATTYATKSEVQPMQETFREGSKYLGKLFLLSIIIVAGLLVVVAILLGKIFGVSLPL